MTTLHIAYATITHFYMIENLDHFLYVYYYNNTAW